jgi:TPR repeat protein
MPPMEPSEGAILLQKGRDLLASGDIAAARVAFRRSADAGNPEAAMALASTYNPDYLAAHQFLGMRGDRATARALYQRAKELGAADAERFILQMQRTR